MDEEQTVDEMKSKEQELQELLHAQKNFENLLKHPGWQQLKAIFEPAFIQMQEFILNNATRTSSGRGVNLDGLQSLQVDAMEKGQLKGMKKVLAFPSQWLLQTKEDIETLRRTIVLKEEKDD